MRSVLSHTAMRRLHFMIDGLSGSTSIWLIMSQNEERSCLYRKVAYYIDIDDDDVHLLEKLEADERTSYPSRRRLRRPGDDVSDLLIVRRGWLYSTLEIDGDRGRHVQGIHFPGDIIGITEITLLNTQSSLIAATDVELCRLPRESLRELFETMPRLAALFFAFGAIENIILAERLAAVARLEADARLAHLLLQIHSRLRVTSSNGGLWFRMPLSQEVLGDAVGLTQAYVNRTFKALEERKLIRRYDNGVELLDVAGLQKLSGFSDRYHEINQSWMPAKKML